MVKTKTRIFLLFGFIVIGSLYAQTNNCLNGKWITTYKGVETEFRFNNGNFESFSMGVPSARGTYMAINGIITINFSHIHGSSLDSFLSGIESRWYTRDEIIIAFRQLEDLSESEIIGLVNGLMFNRRYNYSMDTNSLFLFGGPLGVQMVFTRK